MLLLGDFTIYSDGVIISSGLQRSMHIERIIKMHRFWDATVGVARMPIVYQVKTHWSTINYLTKWGTTELDIKHNQLLEVKTNLDDY